MMARKKNSTNMVHHLLPKIGINFELLWVYMCHGREQKLCNVFVSSNATEAGAGAVAVALAEAEAEAGAQALDKDDNRSLTITTGQ
mmetsp:Transcript_61333/g.70478  ORF Transcript_61333/g.70478 Transcript_61333/m.70478 type:complete len:86 (+) Transcript_61333:21-278(+)